MPVPFFANTEEDREVLLSQRGVSEVFHLANSADLKIVGIGTVDNQAHLVKSGMLEPDELEDIVALGGVGELLGHFFDNKGRTLETSVTARTLAASFSDNGKDRLWRSPEAGKNRSHSCRSTQPQTARADYGRADGAVTPVKFDLKNHFSTFPTTPCPNLAEDRGKHRQHREDEVREGRRVWICTSWKMNKTLAEANVFADGLAIRQLLFLARNNADEHAKRH